MNIVITGSLGHISQPLAEALLPQKHSITIISSSPEKQARIENLGAKAAIGSVLDADFLAHTFTGADAVYCMTPPNFRHPDQLAYYEQTAEAYAAAIRRAGVQRVIYLSSYGAHLPSGTGFITGSYRGEHALNVISGISITHMRPTYFYYNLLHFIPMIQTAGCIGAVFGAEDRLPMVSPKDIAAEIAKEITAQRQGMHIKYVASDERTCNEVAGVLGKALGRPNLVWKVLPPEQVLQSLLKHGMPENAANHLIELEQAIHTGILREDYDKNKPAYGKVSLEDYAGEFAAIYQKSTVHQH
jgi:Predicted nucleoside-diphosphate-sugar epimerases